MSRETIGVGAVAGVAFMLLSLVAVGASRPAPARIEPPPIAVHAPWPTPAAVPVFTVMGSPEPEPPTLAEDAVAGAVARTRAHGGALTEAEMRAVLAEAGAPETWINPMLSIAYCESRHRPFAVGDGGNSLGLFQLWTGWFPAAGYSVADAFDPVVNARVALYVRQVRGRWGGGGGWSCADLWGIP